MKDITDDLPPQVIGDIKQAMTKKCQQFCFNQIIRKMLEQFVKLPNNPGNVTIVDDRPDGVFHYAQEVLTYSLLYAEFEDAIKEGDGLRAIRCWRFLLLIFKASDRTKYAVEAATLLINLHILPERLQQQMIWCRFVNRIACNKPCDLHMEHTNRIAKQALGQQACRNPKSVKRIGNCIGLFQNVSTQFDAVTGAHQSSRKHTRASETTDIQKIVRELLIGNVFL